MHKAMSNPYEIEAPSVSTEVAKKTRKRTTIPPTFTTTLPPPTTRLLYPERIPRARLEATLLNRELDDTLFDARTRLTASKSSWLTAAQDRTIDELLRDRPLPALAKCPTELPPIDDLADGGHGACYTVTLDPEAPALDACLSNLLAQTRAKASRLREALRQALAREDDLVIENAKLRDLSLRRTLEHGAAEPAAIARRKLKAARDVLRDLPQAASALTALAGLKKDMDELARERDAALAAQRKAEKRAGALETRATAAEDEIHLVGSRLDRAQRELAARARAGAAGPGVVEKGVAAVMADAGAAPTLLAAPGDVGDALRLLRDRLDRAPVGQPYDTCSMAWGLYDPAAPALNIAQPKPRLSMAWGLYDPSVPGSITRPVEAPAAPAIEAPVEFGDAPPAHVMDLTGVKNDVAASAIIAAHDLVRALAAAEAIAVGWAVKMAHPEDSGDMFLDAAARLVRAGVLADPGLEAAKAAPAGRARWHAILKGVHPAAGALAEVNFDDADASPAARRLHTASLLSCLLLGATPDACRAIEERAAKWAPPAVINQAVTTVGGYLGNADLANVIPLEADAVTKSVAAIVDAAVTGIGGHSLAHVARKFLCRREASRTKADAELCRLALGADAGASDRALHRFFARVAGVPRGLLAKREYWGMRAVKEALVASAAHDPLAAPGAYAFMRNTIKALVPPSKVREWLGSKEPRLIDLEAVLDAAPPLYESEIEKYKLYPSAENAATAKLPFFLQLTSILAERASKVEAGPRGLRVTVIDALETLVAQWPECVAFVAHETRRRATRDVQRMHRGRLGRTRVALLKKQRAHLKFERRVKTEFRKLDAGKDGLLPPDVFAHLVRKATGGDADAALDGYDRAVDASRRARYIQAQRRRDDGEDVESDEEDDALVVGEVVAVLAEVPSVTSVPLSYAQLPVAPERGHRTWEQE